MLLLGILLFTIAAVILLQGVLVLFQSGSFTRRLFFLITTAFGAIWSITLFMFLSGYSEDRLIISAKIYYIAAAGLPWAMIALAGHFSYKRWSHSISILTAIPYILMSIWLLYQNNPLIDSFNLGSPNTANLNMGNYLWYVIYFTTYSIVAVGVLISGILKSKSTLEKRRLTYVILAYILSLITGSIFNLILPGLGNYDLIWAGPISVLIFASVMFMAIVRFRLFNMRDFAVKILAWLAISIIMTTIYLIVFVIVQSLGIDYDILPIAIALSFAIVSIIIYQIVHRLKNFILHSFGSRLLDEELLDRVSHITLSTIDANFLIEDIAKTLKEYLNEKDAVTIVLYLNQKELCYSTDGKKISVDANIKKIINDNDHDIIVTEEIGDNEPIYNLLTAQNISAIIKIKNNTFKESRGYIEAYGYLVIRSERDVLYSQSGVQVLVTIGNIVSIAIKNIHNYNLIKSFNTRLKEEVTIATHKLKVVNYQLTRLNISKDEFLSIASHQLRTPLTTVKGYLSMLLSGDFGELSPEQTKIIKGVFNSSVQMTSTVSDFLNLTRIQSGKFTISTAPTDLAKLVESQVAQFKNTAWEHNVNLTCNVNDNLPKVNIDKDKIIQVIMNFIDNAIHYSGSKGDVVKVSLHKSDDAIIFKVRDYGIGVPENEQGQMFTKFYRAINAKKIRPDGNGIGLYVAQKIINAHSGEMIFESIEGEGSTFGFKIPINTPPRKRVLINDFMSRSHSQSRM